MQSKATTVDQYLRELSEDRREALQAIREVILEHLPTGYAEGMQYGMIGYFVPHSRYPAGYHCDPRQPLPFGGLASQKNYISIYLMGLYGNRTAEAAFRAAWAKTGRKLDMGKCCIRLKRLEDLPMQVLGDTIAAMPVDKYITMYEAAIGSRGGKPAPAKKTARKGGEPKAPAKKSVVPAKSVKRTSAATPTATKPGPAKTTTKKTALKKTVATRSSGGKTSGKSASSQKTISPKAKRTRSQ